MVYDHYVTFVFGVAYFGECLEWDGKEGWIGGEGAGSLWVLGLGLGLGIGRVVD